QGQVRRDGRRRHPHCRNSRGPRRHPRCRLEIAFAVFFLALLFPDVGAGLAPPGSAGLLPANFAVQFGGTLSWQSSALLQSSNPTPSVAGTKARFLRAFTRPVSKSSPSNPYA